MLTKCFIRLAELTDIAEIAKVHFMSFPRQSNSSEWVTTNLRAYPRILIFAAIIDERIVGYIQYIQKSGFRKSAIIELEQMAVLPEYRNLGIGKLLITDTIKLIQQLLKNNNQQIKGILITTRNNNYAKKLYKDVLKAEEVCIINNLYSADEVILLSTDFIKEVF
jgi:ribosomal protein S18 acetylase RimI-like enzyme